MLCLHRHLTQKSSARLYRISEAKKGISQEVLSGLADIGRTHLSAIERGERKPTLETLYRISNALDIKISTIIIEVEKRIKE